MSGSVASSLPQQTLHDVRLVESPVSIPSTALSGLNQPDLPETAARPRISWSSIDSTPAGARKATIRPLPRSGGLVRRAEGFPPATVRTLAGGTDSARGGWAVWADEDGATASWPAALRWRLGRRLADRHALRAGPTRHTGGCFRVPSGVPIYEPAQRDRLVQHRRTCLRGSLESRFGPLFRAAAVRTCVGGWLSSRSAAREFDGATHRPQRPQEPNSDRRRSSWLWSRWMIELCIWLTRLSERSSVAPISFIVSSS